MSGCRAYASDLDDVAAGGAARPELTAHLAACDACRTALARRQALLARIDASTRSWVAAEPSPHLTTRILARVAAERRRPSSGTPRWRFAAVGVFAALLAFGGYERAMHAVPPSTPPVSDWRSPTATLLPEAPAVLDLRSRGHLLDGENHAD
jgi:anti-sigma factor RsiW